ncbi:MAG: WYL domain-containing protein [Atopobiaceae bacterium]|nr:WYL domain-containing protein [Atopobiaceae bacterium]
MAITREQACQLADLLPDTLGCDNARQRLLAVMTMLTALTDEDHLLSNTDLRRVMEARFGGTSASENTIADDVHAIAGSGCPNLRIHITPRGYWCEHTELTPTKVRLLLNAVQSSRFLTIEQSSELQEDLFGLVSRNQEDDLAGQVHVDQRVRKSYQHVFETLDTVTRAIRLGKRIEFVYTYSDFSSKARPLPGDNGNPLRTETPIALYFSEDNYYVETYTSTPWRHGIEVMLSRADRMSKVRVSEQDAEHSRKVYDLRRSARRRMSECLDMIGGPQRRIFLRVRSDATNVLFDRFGFGLKFSQFEGTLGEPSATGLTLLHIPQAFTFYRWLAATGGGCTITEPPADLVLRSGPWAKTLAGVTREELVHDYEQMVQGFLAYLDRARGPYAGFDKRP